MTPEPRPVTPFDSLLAAGRVEPAALASALQEVLRTLKAPRPYPPPWGYAYDDRVESDDAGRLAVLAAASGDRKLWDRVVGYLVERDAAHRFGQKMSGTPKEDLGPHPTRSRGSAWALGFAERVLAAAPPAVAAPLLATLRDWEDHTI
jgi:hypothetical protein